MRDGQTVGYKTQLHKAANCYWLVFNRNQGKVQMFKNRPTKTQIEYFIYKYIG